MLGEYTDHRSVVIEVTKAEHGHGGPGWEFGTCLWSPERTKGGQDLYRLLREAVADDLVLHIQHDVWGPGEREHRIVGRSFVAGRVDLRDDEPPSPGDWSGQEPFYRVPLRDYVPFPETISLSAFIPLYEGELRTELATKPHAYPPCARCAGDSRLPGSTSSATMSTPSGIAITRRPRPRFGTFACFALTATGWFTSPPGTSSRGAARSARVSAPPTNQRPLEAESKNRGPGACLWNR